MARATPLILPLPVADRLRAIARLQPPGPRHIPERRKRPDAGPPPKQPYPPRAARSPLWNLQPGECLTFSIDLKKVRAMLHNFVSRNPGWKFAKRQNADGSFTVRCVARAHRKAKA